MDNLGQGSLHQHLVAAAVFKKVKHPALVVRDCGRGVGAMPVLGEGREFKGGPGRAHDAQGVGGVITAGIKLVHTPGVKEQAVTAFDVQNFYAINGFGPGPSGLPDVQGNTGAVHLNGVNPRAAVNFREVLGLYVGVAVAVFDHKGVVARIAMEYGLAVHVDEGIVAGHAVDDVRAAFAVNGVVAGSADNVFHAAGAAVAGVKPGLDRELQAAVHHVGAIGHFEVQHVFRDGLPIGQAGYRWFVGIQLINHRAIFIDGVSAVVGRDRIREAALPARQGDFQGVIIGIGVVVQHVKGEGQRRAGGWRGRNKEKHSVRPRGWGVVVFHDNHGRGGAGSFARLVAGNAVNDQAEAVLR